MSARSRATTLAIAMVVTFVMMRAYLHLSPNTDLTIAGYDIHHLFTGLILITLGGIATVVMPAAHRYSQTALTIFGVGLALALDEWLYLIVTDGTNASYLLPVSFWGGFAAIALAVTYAVVVSRIAQSS
jgi:energy-converting hydrogenase Eha subunit E